MITVRTTMRPDEDLEVDEREYQDLKAQGLILADEPAAEPEPTTEPARPRAGRANRELPQEGPSA